MLDIRLAQSGVAPLPVLLDHVIPLAFKPKQDRPDPWLGRPGDDELIWAPRFANAIVGGVGLISLVFGWVYRRRGLAAASFGATMIGLSPTIVAHASLATTDVIFALCAMITLATLVAYLRSPTWGRLFLLAVATAGAMAAKYSGLFLVSTTMILLLAQAFASPSAPPQNTFLRSVRSSTLACLVFLCLLMPVWWGFHLWSFAGPLKASPVEQTPDGSGWVKLFGRGPAAIQFMDLAHRKLKIPAPLAGLQYQYSHNRAGHRSYLMGEVSRTSWWYYYPSAFAFKSTPSELILAAGLLLALVASMRRPLKHFRESDISMRVLFVASGVFTLMVLTSKLGIGHRYVIVLYPMIAIAGADRLFAWLRPRYAMTAAVILLCGQAVSNVTIAPHFLAYFNGPSGGPGHGRELLVDSNLDWGQDLPALRHALLSQGEKRTALYYFGTADVTTYGVTADPVEQLPNDPDQYELLAISVTHLQGVYADGENPFRAFQHITPVAQAGYSILVFDLNTPERRVVFRNAVEQLKRSVSKAKGIG